MLTVIPYLFLFGKMIHIINKKDCCGCASCIQKCPTKCIIWSEDSEGFFYPKVDVEKCIECGLCEKVCPMIHTRTPIAPIAVYGVKNKNDEERMSSSSGGVFLPLAREVINKGGVVFGAIYDKNWNVLLSYTDTLDGVYAMMGSKYVQAQTGKAYQDAEFFLKQNKEVLFTGTPCQIAGLRRFLGKDYENLLTVDFACHGVPSPGVWQRYLGELGIKLFANKVSVEKGMKSISPFKGKISNIEFRNKTLNGWKKYTFVVRGKTIDENGENVILLSDNQNSYMRGFLYDLYLRPSCHECRCKNGVNHSDITIGDLWGVNEIIPNFDDDKGTSLVFIFSSKGLNYFNKLPMEIYACDYKSIVDRNGGFNEYTYPHPKRNAFFYAYNLEQPIEETVTKLLYEPIIAVWSKRIIWGAFKMLVPISVVKYVRCFFKQRRF